MEIKVLIKYAEKLIEENYMLFLKAGLPFNWTRFYEDKVLDLVAYFIMGHSSEHYPASNYFNDIENIVDHTACTFNSIIPLNDSNLELKFNEVVKEIVHKHLEKYSILPKDYPEAFDRAMKYLTSK